MNVQEREQLSAFLQQLSQARVAAKDGEADTLIKEACARQPDASYLLVQRALLLDQAWQAAQAQIGQLQAELAQARQAAPAGAGGFLGGNAWGNSAPAGRAAPPAGAPTTAYAAAPAVAAAAPAGSGWGSTLGTVASTAAGVAAGAFLFQGISHMFNGNHASGFLPGAGNTPLDQLSNNSLGNNAYASDSSAGSDYAQADLDALPDNSDMSGDWV